MAIPKTPREHLALHPHPSRITQPLPFFHPTRALMIPTDVFSPGKEVYPTRWSSRASRKNRFTLKSTVLHHHVRPSTAPHILERQTSTRTLIQRPRYPHSRLKVHLGWDVSFWVAVAFVLGSATWICNGHLLYTPLSPTPSPPYETAAVWLAFVGGTCFEVGAYLMYVESLPANTGHAELYDEFHEHLYDVREELEKSEGCHKPGNLVEINRPTRKRRIDTPRFRWIGIGSIRDIGYLASSIQLFAATIFWISTITGLPNIIPTLTEKNTPVSVVLFWTPQVVGGTGFIIASILLMLEEQKTWWKVTPLRLGWQVAFWNLVGAIGFTLCGALGYAATSSSRANYQSILATFWGSWAFMIGSAIQLWETLWREDPAGTNNNESTDKGENLVSSG